ncbi:MAG: DUF3298 and DUF4163 domain-containing protein [Patescibacteria group bacterium]|jgi:hypothetical protein
MKHLFVPSLLTVAILGAGCPEPVATTPTPIIAVAPSAPATKIDASLFVKETIHEEAARYEIDVSYPRMNGFVDADIQAAFNELIEQRVQDRIAEFRKIQGEFENESSEIPNEPNWFLGQDFDVYTGAFGRFSIVMEGSEYTGGAHPNAFYDTVVFDLSTKKEVMFKDLFTSPEEGLVFVSDYAITELTERNTQAEFTDDEWMQSGAGPKEDNYTTWYLTEKELVIIFTPYQVAAYAAGPSEVRIPYDAMKGLLAL